MEIRVLFSSYTYVAFFKVREIGTWRQVAYINEA